VDVDPRLTSMLVCVLLYAGYLMLRGAMEDPTARARASAVLSILAFVDVPIVFFSIRWWRTHTRSRWFTAREDDPAMMNMLFLNWVPVLLLAVVMVMVRLRQEEMGREVDALRRQAHAL